MKRDPGYKAARMSRSWHDVRRVETSVARPEVASKFDIPLLRKLLCMARLESLLRAPLMESRECRRAENSASD